MNLVNHSFSNLATRNSEVAKMKRENFNVAKDIRLTGLAKLFVADFLNIFISSDGFGIVRVKELKHKELYDVTKDEKLSFEIKVEEEFKSIGYDGRIRHNKSYDDDIEIKIL